MALRGNGCIGLLREVRYARAGSVPPAPVQRWRGRSKWERRVPLAPQHVKQLIDKHKLRVLVQPSNHRVFSDQQYHDAGAIVQEDLSGASCILGVKQVAKTRRQPSLAVSYLRRSMQVSIEDLIPQRTYM